MMIKDDGHRTCNVSWRRAPTETDPTRQSAPSHGGLMMSRGPETPRIVKLGEGLCGR
jgi:hypothetical protein